MEENTTATLTPPDTPGITPGTPGTPDDETTAQSSEQAQPQPLREPARRDKGGFVWGTGRRKSAIARVRIRPAQHGEGRFTVSGPKARGRSVEEFFSEPQHRNACYAPLEATGARGNLDVVATTLGGGITGQAEAILLGVARALVGYDPSLEHALREHGYMTRDPREVERKKYGQAGARRRFQFSKR